MASSNVRKKLGENLLQWEDRVIFTQLKKILEISACSFAGDVWDSSFDKLSTIGNRMHFAGCKLPASEWSEVKVLLDSRAHALECFSFTDIDGCHANING